MKLHINLKKFINNPKSFFYIFIVFALYKSCEFIVGSLQIGMNIDEPYHLNQAQLWLNNFSYISSDESGPSFTYGPLIGILQILTNFLLGNGSLRSYENFPLTFEINHLLVAFIGFSACLILIKLNKSISNLKNLGYLSSIFLFSLPIWVGNSFHNMKDIPTATGYTFVTVGCYLLLNSFLKNSHDFKPILVIYIGLLLVLGTRPALLLPVLLSFFLSLGYLKFVLKITNILLLKIFLLTLVPTMFSFLILLPHFIQFPLKSIKETFYTSSNFPWNGSVLTGAKLEDPVLTFSYFGKWLFAQSPLIIFILFITGFIFFILRNLKNIKSEFFVISCLFLIQLTLLPVYLFITKAPIYNGLRHILFIYPSIAFFAAIGFYFVFNLFRRKFNVLLFLILMGLLLPNLESLRLMPFQQIYYNPLISVFYNVASDWDTDYYGISSREAFQHLPKNGKLVKTSEWVWQEPAFLKERGLKASEAKISDSEYWMVSGIYSYIDGDSRIRMLKSKAPLEALKPTCSAEYVVTRKLRFETIPLAFVQRCQNSGKLLNGYASITWSSPTEVSENQQPFFWLTSNGESIRITNMTSRVISRNLQLDVSANPCQTLTSLNIKSKNFSQNFEVSNLENVVTKVIIPIQINPYQTSKIKLTPADDLVCVLQNKDSREFISKISNIEIVD